MWGDGVGRGREREEHGVAWVQGVWVCGVGWEGVVRVRNVVWDGCRGGGGCEEEADNMAWHGVVLGKGAELALRQRSRVIPASASMGS